MKSTLPVFPNRFPYNDMLLDGRLKVGSYDGVKTRKWEWNYRGPVLFYNSLRTDKPAVTAYGYRDNPSQHKIIIGIGDLIDVRQLTYEEALQMVCNFNNLSPEKVVELLRSEGEKEPTEDPADSLLFCFYTFGPYIAPFTTGFFFKNLARFKKPVPFSWPSGPIKPIFTKFASNSKLMKAVLESGYRF